MLCAAVLAAWAPLCRQAQAAPQLPAPFAFDSAPGRLPKNVVPLAYSIAITPDAAALTIAGHESIELDFRQATATIQFNSIDETLADVRLDGKPVKTVASDDKAQLSTITLDKPAQPGRHRLSFSYVGRIGTGQVGLYAQPFVKPDGDKDLLLTTQFEATDARRMFPCWDEPAFRATFQLTVTTSAAWATYSNMPIARRTVHGDLATTVFERSPKMASYLVEFTAGRLAQIGGQSAGTELNVVAVKGQEQGGAAALANARQILADYNGYFGLRFPLPKLDSLALPGGFGGAMENWGAITYNDQRLLITPASTMANRQTVFSIQAHEMAHQWFGDLVTMGWWDDLWLNESFASWMAARETAIRNPSWHWWERQDASKEAAMGADAYPTSHPILQHVTNELEASSAFDSRITYNKGQSVLRMLEAYLGPDVFRDGVRGYMKAHAYSNTSGGDLWAALAAASQRPVGEVAASWIAQAGFPLVSAQAACNAAGERTVTLSQSRFLLDGSPAGGARWQVPLQVRVGEGKGEGATAQAVLLSTDGQSLPAGRCDEALSLNADAIGYYRVAYDAGLLAVNTRNIARMPDGDRIALLDDQWALVEAGAAPLPSYLALVSALGTVLNERAWEQVTQALDTLEKAERGTPGHAAFAAYARSLIKPLQARLGWVAKADELPGIQGLRRTVITELGAWGDPEVIAEARRRFAGFVADRSSLSVDDQAMVLQIIAKNADATEFEQLHAIARASRNETEVRRYYGALMQVGNPAWAAKSIAIVMSDELPKQAQSQRMYMLLALSDEHPALAWDALQDRLEVLLAPFKPYGSSMLAGYVPEHFWRTVPADPLEAWVRARTPAELAPVVDRSMQTARFKQAEKDRLVQAADTYLASQPR